MWEDTASAWAFTTVMGFFSVAVWAVIDVDCTGAMCAVIASVWFVTGAMGDVVGSGKATHALHGLLQTLCGISQPLCGLFHPLCGLLQPLCGIL